MRNTQALKLRTGDVVWATRLVVNDGQQLHLTVREGVVVDVIPDKHVVKLETPDGDRLTTTPFHHVHADKQSALYEAKRRLFLLRDAVDKTLTQLTSASA